MKPSADDIVASAHAPDVGEIHAVPRECPSVVIVGRPNVGKSTLFNRLVGARRAIVGDEPGITRDRLHGRVRWRGREFELVDTGGLLPDEDALIPASIVRQAEVAIARAALLLFMVDVREGMTPLDEDLARRLRRFGKPIFLIVNKVDAARWEVHVEEFRRLGFSRVFPISAEHGHGIGELLEAILEIVPAPEVPETRPEEIRLAIIGRPNVGKSSLVNRLLGTERVIVAPTPGTTRDAVDSELEYEGTRFRVIDTAGIRRKSRVLEQTERVAVLMAKRHIERADVAVLLIDALEGPTALEAHIGGFAHEAGKSLILAVNKWDLVEKDHTAAARMEAAVRARLRFLDYAPLVFISALTGQHVTQILELAKKAYEARHLRIPTAELNRFFQAFVAESRATTSRRHVRVQYLTQAGVDPPTFILFLNSRREKLEAAYERYIENRLREQYEFFATPIRIKQRLKT
ncbi:MAG: ribosome biogenesis GTPase Der [Blastocatellia bacterium]|nr:ribosome biogenesis GTPase Der [Blastocatellia bacterium]MCS7156598.1 ribosome biogenesis GTPase Der [Blastocatellia bacterium]MCX7751660.1 ribosome biogenesis GTPase Der [Blastocatellia bacterium]MDW8168760.1 ribosome biogenesis GTPase Der [Acidobacteriota bacterium]MDW8257026.1 ribosome biogenesis GTPase Der [Acidobacteriota bacterium]